MPTGKYRDLLKSFGFQSFLWTQFLGAFNDNVFKIVVSMVAVNMATGPGGGSGYLSLAGAVFILPFFLFSGYAGHLADTFNKRSVLIVTKALEIIAMGLGLFALLSGRIGLMLGVLFLMALQSTLFSPAKYGILPEMLPDKDLSRANGLLEMSTFMAIILGTSIGSMVFTAWKGAPGIIGIVLIGIAVTGTITSLGISRVPDPRTKKEFRLNPWAEVVDGIKRLYSEKTLWLTVIGISCFWFLGALLQMDIILFGKEVMGLDELRIGLLVAFLAVGIGVGSLAAGRLSGDKIELGLVPFGSIGMGMFAILLSFSAYSYAQTGVALFLLGFSGGLFIVPLNALLQQKSGQGEKGRLIATNNFMNTLGILLASGAIWIFRDLLQVHADRIILIFGLLTIGATIYVLSILPDFMIRFTIWILTHTIYRVRIVGRENIPIQGPALLVSNHVSFVDGLLIGTSIQRFIRFMILKSYYEINALKWLFGLLKAIPVSEGNQRGVIESLKKAREELTAGHMVCIFAEGSISRTGNLLPFKRGLERIINGLDIPIIPVHLDGLWGSIFSFKGRQFFWKWPERIPYPVTVSFGRPLPSTATTQEVRQAVMELGSEAVQYRRTKGDLLHLRFIKSAKKHWSNFCMADSSGRELTYGKTLVGSLLLARWIRKELPGDKPVLSSAEVMVGLLLPASVAGALTNIAILLAGKIPVNLNFTSGKEAMESAIRQCNIKTIMTSRVFLAKAKLDEIKGMVFLEEIMKQTTTIQKTMAFLLAFILPSRLIQTLYGHGGQNPDVLATVIFSSGSTGVPKGVMLSHNNILSNIEGFAQVISTTRADRVMGILPFFHSFGFTGTLWFPLLSGFGAVYHANPMDAKTIGEMVSKYKATIIISTPTFYGTYLKRCTKEEFSTLRLAVAGAEKLREPLSIAFKEKFGIDLLEGYGCTEMGPVVSVNIPDVRQGPIRQTGHKFGTVGHPIPGIAVKVIDPDTGKPLPGGREGLLLVKGPNRMIGYLGRPEKTKEVLQDGWYMTGDIASIDEEGFIRITDRISRFSKIGGEMVPHLRIEDAINKILGGDHSCVVTAIPDDQKGERIVAFYTNREIMKEDLWKGLCETDLPKLWIPKQEHIQFIEEIPLLGTGKIDLKKMKELAMPPPLPPSE